MKETLEYGEGKKAQKSEVVSFSINRHSIRGDKVYLRGVVRVRNCKSPPDKCREYLWIIAGRMMLGRVPEHWRVSRPDGSRFSFSPLHAILVSHIERKARKHVIDHVATISIVW